MRPQARAEAPDERMCHHPECYRPVAYSVRQGNVVALLCAWHALQVVSEAKS